MSKPCIVCDLDRVLFHTNAWEEFIPKDRYSREGWDEFNRHSHLAVPNYYMFGKIMKYSETCPIFFITSREEDIRKETEEQIFIGSCWKITVAEKHSNLLYLKEKNPHQLLMRPHDCFDDDAPLKERLLREHVLANDFFPLVAIDDNESVCRMYESLGIITWQYDIATDRGTLISMGARE